MTVPRPATSVRDRLADLALMAVSALGALAIAGEAEQRGQLTGDALNAAFGLAVLGTVALWFRRRYPVAVTVVLALLLTVTDLVIVAVLIAVYTVSALRSWSTTAATFGASLLIYVPYSVLFPAPELSAFNTNMIYVALMSLVMAAGSTTRARYEAIAGLYERAERAEIEAQERAEQLRVQERQRIAGEMHDVLAHRISLVSLQAGALEVRSDLPSGVAESVTGIRLQSHRALEDLRDILGVLRAGTDTDGLRPQPGIADLARLVAEARAAGTEICVDFRATGDPSEHVGRTIYRLVQEGLTNARKHAQGRPVEILLERAGAREIRVRLRNAPASPGGTPVPGSHSGLVGLAERVALAGGRLSYGMRRVPEGGVVFQVEAWLPWSA